MRHRAGRVAPDIFRRTASDAELADFAAAQTIAFLDPARGHIQRHDIIVTLDHHRQRYGRVEPHDLLHILEAVDGPPVDACDRIAGAEAARLGRAAWDHLADLGRGERLAV